MSDVSEGTVLIVDDLEVNLDLLGQVLSEKYDTATATEGEDALAYARAHPPDLVLLDIMMPQMDGYEVCRRLKADPATEHIPVIFVTAKAETEDEMKGLELGGVDYITKPINPPIVRARVANHIELKKAREALQEQNRTLEEKVKERTQEVTRTQDVTIQSMATLAEYRDPETGGHIRRTQHYIGTLAETLRDHPDFRDLLAPYTIEMLARSAPLHDIGKVGVPDYILLKPGKLTAEEFEEMKKHPKYGRDALSVSSETMGDNSFLGFGMEIAYTHHEKWDGSGYPQGLSGRDIPLSGRLMALVDVYDALISKRVYKPPFSHTKAVSIIEEGKGSHFDPDVVEGFQKITEDFRNIALKYADFDEERNMLSQ